MPVFGSPRYRPALSRRGGSSLWGRAWLHKAVAATGIDIGPTRGALLHLAPGFPFGSGRDRVDVLVDIGLCIRGPHPKGRSQNAHASDGDQSALHDLPPFDK